jgi:hypothetical protein
LWRCMMAAMLTVLAQCLAVTVVYGVSIWGDWVAMLPGYTQWYEGHVREMVNLVPSLVANLVTIGVPARVASAIQWGCSALMAGLTWRAFRQGVTARAVSVLVLATLLFLNHVFYYDMVMMVAAFLLLLRERMRAGWKFSLTEIALLTFSFLFPLLHTIKSVPLPVSSLSLIALLALVWWRMPNRAAVAG